MKVMVIHDEAGKIARLTAYPASDGLGVKPVLEEGQQATELDLEVDDADAVGAQLADLRKNYRLEAEGESGRLVRR